jgi:hypothetical protein
MQICYLLAFPDTSAPASPVAKAITGLKDAPYFQPVDVRIIPLGLQSLHVEAVSVTVLRQRLDDRVQVVEARFELPNALSADGIQHRQRIERGLREAFLPATYAENWLYEEYIVLLLSQIPQSPDAFIEQNAGILARFMRAQREVFDTAERDEILQSRVRYSKDDLTLVDWDGAVIISPSGDFQSDIELLKIGNYQLLRYRMLDQSIETSLHEINGQFKAREKSPLRPGPTRSSLRRIVNLRLELTLDFEHTDQNLLLIGDWYTAKLYHAIREELYLDNWKETIRNKLDTLETVIHIIQENFSLTWQGLMEQVELAGWIILLIGYFILFFMEIGVSH